MKKIFLIGGGTGGHLFPALALSEELKLRNYIVHLITDTRCEKYLPKNIEFPTHILALGSLRPTIVSKAFMAFKMSIALLKSIFLFLIYRPSLVIGFGGYTSFPSLLAARLLKIPIMLHEQNCFLGKVNRFFAKSANKIALNFEDTKAIPSYVSSKIVVTGNPVRKEISNRKIKKKKGNGYFNILVVGGSQSANIFSSLIPDAISIITSSEKKIKIFIVQQALKKDWEYLENAYNSNLCVKFEIAEFFDNMPDRYNESDIVICRSGASTIAELISLGKPAIMIPFPAASDNHQFYNAKFLENKNASWCFEQKNVTPEILAKKIIALYSNKNLLEEASKNLSQLKLDSSCILADTVEKIMSQEV